jgi:hypothetical protein
MQQGVFVLKSGVAHDSIGFVAKTMWINVASVGALCMHTRLLVGKK